MRCAVLTISLLICGGAVARELAWEEAVRLTASHPEIIAATARLNAARKDDAIAHAELLPALNVSALESIGLPGSSGATGIPGVVNSPFTETPAVGADIEWTIWDFGRTSSAVAEAKAGVRSAHARVRQARERVFLRLLSAFSRVAMYVQIEELVESRHAAVSDIRDEVAHYVNVGLRSAVDGHLIAALLLKVSGRQAQLAGWRKVAEADLREATGLPVGEPFTCVIGSQSSGSIPSEAEFVRFSERMPEAAASRADLERAEASRRGAQAERWPRLVGVGSAGWSAGYRFVDDDPFSVGLGLRIPIFEGFRTKARIQQAKSEVDASHARMDAVLARTRARLSRIHALAVAAAERRRLAAQEEDEARKGYELGRKRYLDRRAELAEFREAEAGYYLAAERRRRVDVDYWMRVRLLEFVGKMKAAKDAGHTSGLPETGAKAG